MTKSQHKKRGPVHGVSKSVFFVSVLFALMTGAYMGNILTVAVLHKQPQEEGVTPELQGEIEKWLKETRANPGNVAAWNNLAFLYHDTHQHDAAIQAYEQSLKLAPGVPDIMVDLGVMYRAVKRPQKAVELFDGALRTNPSHQIALLNKGVVLYYDLNDAAGAKAAWQALLRLNPKAALPDGTLVADTVRRM